MHARPRILRGGATFVLATLAACSAETGSGPSEVDTSPGRIASAAAPAPSALAGTDVVPTPAVRVTTSAGAPVEGVAVYFAVTEGGGSITGPSQVTDAAGIATVGSWRLGTAAGSNVLMATVTALPALKQTFTVTATQPAVARIEKLTADPQAAPVSTAYADSIAVRVLDASGNPMAGVPVAFTTTSGAVSPSSTVTTSAGVARARWTLGTTTGAVTATAQAGGQTAFFSTTALPGVPSQITIAAGNGQSATTGTAVAVRPAVAVRDQHGNAVSGVQVTFAVTTGGGVVTGATATTDAAGVGAAGSWTLGSTTGTNTLTATVQNLTPVEFTATATAPAVAFLSANSGDQQYAAVAGPVPTAPSVRVLDADYRPVAGVTVTFAVGAGGGTITGATPVTDSLGIAAVGSWTLGTAAGANTLMASIAGSALPPVTFTATGSQPTSITTYSISDEYPEAGTRLADTLEVRVTDANSRALPGVRVTFSVVRGGGTIVGGEQVTDEWGQARLASWTMGPQPDTNQVEVSVAELRPVTFTVIGTRSCSGSAIHTLGSATSGVFDDLDCRIGSNGQPADVYTMTIGTPQAVTITETSGDVDSHLWLFDAIGRRLGDVDEWASSPERMKVLLGAGTYRVAPSVYYHTERGSYTIGSETSSADVAGCELAFVTNGSVTAQQLQATDCSNTVDGSTFYGDQFKVYLAKGQTLRAEVKATAFDTYATLTDYYGRVVVQNDNGAGGTNALIAYTASADGYFYIDASSRSAATTGAYSLSVTVTDAAASTFRAATGTALNVLGGGAHENPTRGAKPSTRRRPVLNVARPRR